MMKACPNSVILAELALGKITGHRRRQVLTHVRNCVRCLKELRTQVGVIADLSSAEIAPEGLASLRLTEPRPEVGRELQLAMLQAIKQTKRRKRRLRALVEKLLAEFFPIASSAAPEPAILSFRTRSPGIAGGQPKQGGAKVQQGLSDGLVSLLEKLLEPAMPAHRRAHWLARLNSELEKMRREAIDQPTTKSRAAGLSVKAQPWHGEKR